ncbi:MAG: lipoprotein-releasing ABC transporter permease subunit [Pseudomonadota bacterium]
MTVKYKTLPFARFEWMLAFRYLRARRKEGFISVIAGFSFLGIMLGVATLIIVMAVLNGFHNQLLDKVLGLNGHVIVHKIGDPFIDYQDMSKRMRNIENVRLSIPLIEGQAMVSTPSEAKGTLVRGIAEQDLKTLEKISRNIIDGTLDGFESRANIVIGQVMAEALGLKVGGALTLISPRGGQATPYGKPPKVKRFRVAAIFKIGMSEYDRSITFLPMSEAQKFFGKLNRVDVLEILVKDPNKVQDILPKLQETGGDTIYLTDWRQHNAGFFNALKVQQNVTFIILLMILIVATFNIISGIIMLVKDKGRDIAVLRTLGASRSAIMRVFVITGASIGVVGTLTGFLIGVVVCLNIDVAQDWVAFVTGYRIDPTIYQLSELPAEINSFETAAIVAMSIVLSIMATFYPSWRAAKMDPVRALRYE